MLASCSPGPQVGGGIGGTGGIASIASGPITGFGSVFVSGYEYDTGSTAMKVDGKPGSLSDLKKGMLVRVNASVVERYDTHEALKRTANTLLYEDAVEGVVQSVAPDGSSLVVLGQTVMITSSTIVDASIPERNVLRLVPSRDLVELSGFITGDGTIMGTFVELKTIDMKTQAPDYEVKGFIKNHKAAQKTFEIGALTIDYTEAKLNDMPGQFSDDWNGLLVDATGDQVSSGGLGSSDVRMKANLVWPETLGSNDSEDVQVEGFVTQELGSGNFSIGIVRVQTNAETRFEGGTSSNIQVGVRLEVHGAMVGGIVKATTVELEEAELKGTVTHVLSPGDFFLGNLHVQTDVGTLFAGGTVNDILVGAHLEVYGPLLDGTVKATKVEFESERHAAVVSCLNDSPSFVCRFNAGCLACIQADLRHLASLNSGNQEEGKSLSSSSAILKFPTERFSPTRVPYNG